MNLSKKGFTLIELLLVIAIISILLVVVFAALNPATRLAESRNARRWNDVNQELTAIHECLVDNDGSFGSCGLANDGVLRQVGDCLTGGATNCAGANDACENNLDDSPMNTYIANPPKDPSSSGSDNLTGYTVQISNGIVTVASCLAESGETISVAR